MLRTTVSQNGISVAQVVKLERGDRGFNFVRPWILVRNHGNDSVIGQFRTQNEAFKHAKDRFLRCEFTSG
jgi:hypothetical protein